MNARYGDSGALRSRVQGPGPADHRRPRSPDWKPEAMSAPDPARLLQRGRQLEYATLGWNVVGVVILAVGAIGAGSVALAGFGLDQLRRLAVARPPPRRGRSLGIEVDQQRAPARRLRHHGQMHGKRCFP